ILNKIACFDEKTVAPLFSERESPRPARPMSCGAEAGAGDRAGDDGLSCFASCLVPHRYQTAKVTISPRVGRVAGKIKLLNSAESIIVKISDDVVSSRYSLYAAIGKILEPASAIRG